MPRYEKDKLTYITMYVFKFAERFGADPQVAMQYLLRYRGFVI